MSPETQPGRDVIAIAGPNSTGKSELARQLSLYLRDPQDGKNIGVDTRVIHVGDIYRFCAGLPGGFPLDDPEQIRASAHEALAHVHCEVDKTTGEIFLKPNGIDRFLQSAQNGQASSKLGGNPHLVEFVTDFVLDLLDAHLEEQGIAIIDGRESWGAQVVVRTSASMQTRANFFYEERLEAKDWAVERVEQTIRERDIFDEPILAPVMDRQDHVIGVMRTDHTIGATRRVAEQVGGIIFQYKEGHAVGFESRPMMITDNR